MLASKLRMQNIGFDQLRNAFKAVEAKHVTVDFIKEVFMFSNNEQTLRLLNFKGVDVCND